MPQSQKVRGVTVEIQSILRMDDILQDLRSFLGATMLQGTMRIAPKGFSLFLVLLNLAEPLLRWTGDPWNGEAILWRPATFR